MNLTETTEFTDRDGIVDAVTRVVEGIDFGSEDLLRSAFTEDAVFDLSGIDHSIHAFEPCAGHDQVARTLMRTAGLAMDAFPALSNIRVRVDGDTAQLTCYPIGQHHRAGEGPSVHFQGHLPRHHRRGVKARALRKHTEPLAQLESKFMKMSSIINVEKEAVVMRAIGLTEFGGPEVLRAIELPDPVAGAGEVRIRVHAASVSPTDTLLRAGAAPALFEGRPGPYVPGMDAAGVVDAIGPDTDTPLRPGDPVIAIVRAYGPRGGAYAELVVAPAESVVPIPSDADFPSASTLLMNALTARVALDLLAVPPGRTVAVTGAAGAFGGYAVQLAKSDGLRVLADASAADMQLVASLGADEVVLRGDDVAARFRALTPDGVDAVLDGATLNELIVPAIRDGGGLAVIRGWDGPVDHGIRLHPVRVTEAATDHARLLRLRDQASTGELTLRVADVLPADQAAQAHRRLAEGGVRGRLVLDFTAF